MMEHLTLVCCETDIGVKSQRAIADPVLLNDKRVLANLLATEDKYLPHTCYFNCVQTDIEPYMRKMVAEWMAEVCSEKGMEEEVFPLSVNYLDRFLCVRNTKRTRLQLLGAACMFLASKLKQSTPITGEDLVMYTDHSISLEELTEMESLILHLLKWDLSAIVPNDFLDHILHRLPLAPYEWVPIKRHAQTFAALCATDCRFMQTPPSMIACCSIGASLRALKGHSEQNILNLHMITGIDMDLIRSCMEQVEQIVRTCFTPSAPQNQHSVVEQEGTNPKQEQPTTPTDVREINIVSMDSSNHHPVPQAIPVVY